jgi:transposase
MKTSEPAARVEEVNRKQTQLEVLDFDRLIAADHAARGVWAMVEQLDLSRFYAPIRAREGGVGRTATDPKVMLALWLFAISDGVGSAREIVRLTEEHDAYRWLRGGVSLNHHTLSDFRTAHPEAVNDLLTQIIASLLSAGLLTLHRVALDGTKVRASAGAASFRRKESLHKLLKRARQQLRAVDESAKDGTRTKKQEAAQQRAAEERAARVQQALDKLPLLRTPKMDKKREAKGKKPAEPRASTTDADARVMKDGGGGFRPSFNVQLATEGEHGILIGARVATSPADNHQMVPMLDDIEARTGAVPDQLLVDAGYVHFDSVDEAAERGVAVFMPLDTLGAKPRADGTKPDPYEKRETDSPAIAELRARMKSKSGRTIYKERAPTAERPNAHLKERMDFRRFLVRGLEKVTTVTLLTAVAFNIHRIMSLGWSL